MTSKQFQKKMIAASNLLNELEEAIRTHQIEFGGTEGRSIWPTMLISDARRQLERLTAMVIMK